MFCGKCGKEIEEGIAICPGCGSPVHSSQAGQSPVINTSNTRSSVFYLTLALAVLECVFPFMPWVKVPLYNAIGNFFGASSDISSHSLFGYIGTIQDDSTFTSVVILVLCIGTLVGVVFNVLYIVKGLKNTGKYGKFGRIAALLMCIVSAIFLIVMGLSTLIIRLVKITPIPFLLLVVSFLNGRLIKSQCK